MQNISQSLSYKESMHNKLNVKIFADGANLQEIKTLSSSPWVQGFTTNPTLMRQAGVKDYKNFALQALKIVGEKPISFEVFADEFAEMQAQALEIASWGKNVYVKIPIMNTKGQSSIPLIQKLSSMGVFLNVTAIFTESQAMRTIEGLSSDTPSIISIFAGRIADTGRDPMQLMRQCSTTIQEKKNIELLWASPREIYNLYQADEVGAHIITLPNDLLKKLQIQGKDLELFSKETVQMFYDDAMLSNYSIPVALETSYQF